jgi:sigma-E factor negative regulatory protein RseA
MSEQIREQVSAFLDGELPSSETELLLKRLTRDCELRQSFGRYALIGESLRGASRMPLTRGFASRVNQAIDGEPATPDLAPGGRAHAPRWWRPVAGAAVAASVAAVAVVGLQRHVVPPQLREVVAVTQPKPEPKEPISYTVPAARLTNYVFAHSRYSSGLAQSSLSALLADPADQGGGAEADSPLRDVSLQESATPPTKDPRIVP